MSAGWTEQATDSTAAGRLSTREAPAVHSHTPPAAFSATISVPATARTASRAERAAKRAIDYVGAGIGLLVISPLLLIIAVLIKVGSPGPVLFRQTRIGKSGRPFTFYKFRSMEHGCDPAIHREHVTKLISGQVGDEVRNADGTFKLDCDPRVTPIGKFLRRSSMDELPQLFNVLKGEMSLVGPRPPLDYEVEVYSPRHLRRLEVLPGITGLWQVSGRTRLSFEEMVELDIKYVDAWSLGMDVRILLKTFSAVLGTEGAG